MNKPAYKTDCSNHTLLINFMQLSVDCVAGLVAGAAGNFVCALDRMSFNAFKTVMDIDALGTFNVSKVVFDNYFKVWNQFVFTFTAYR